MPRIAREKSKSGVYHVIFRGVNRQEIFHDEEDCARFLGTLCRYKKKSDIKVYGWCLMGNHVHLLLQEGSEELAVTMKRIGVSYAWYYNLKYRTTGHLFQDRYKSEKVESSNYLMTVVRYIHQNPVKAGMVKCPDEWKWSSCQAYYGIDCEPPSLLDSGLVLSILSEGRKNGIAKFVEFNEAGNKEVLFDDMDGIIRRRQTDEEASALIGMALDGWKIPEIKSLPRVKRDEFIAKLKKIDGISQRQLSRILGISLSLINRA